MPAEKATPTMEPVEASDVCCAVLYTGLYGIV